MLRRSTTSYLNGSGLSGGFAEFEDGGGGVLRLLGRRAKIWYLGRNVARLLTFDHH